MRRLPYLPFRGMSERVGTSLKRRSKMFLACHQCAKILPRAIGRLEVFDGAGLDDTVSDDDDTSRDREELISERISKNAVVTILRDLWALLQYARNPSILAIVFEFIGREQGVDRGLRPCAELFRSN